MKKYKELLNEDAIVEITKEEALELLPRDTYNELDNLWDCGHINEYDNDGIVENSNPWLPKHIEDTRKLLDEETEWFLKNDEGKIVLWGQNDIAGYGYTEEIDVTENYNQLDY